MNNKIAESPQPKYEELGHKIKDLTYDQTKLLSQKYQTQANTFKNNEDFEPNYKTQQNPLNLSLMEEENQVLMILRNLKQRHEEIENVLGQKENEKNAIMEDINILTQRLKMLDKSIAKKKSFYENYEKTIKDAENAFIKINESTKTLFSVLKKENLNLKKLTGMK